MGMDKDRQCKVAEQFTTKSGAKVGYTNFGKDFRTQRQRRRNRTKTPN